MAKKKSRAIKKQNQTSGRRRDSRRYSSTSTSTDFNNDLFIGIDKLNLNEEDENFFRNLVLSNKAGTNFQQQQFTSRPRGLVNLGNTCYLNSAIQILGQTPFFYELLNKRADVSVNWQAIHRDYFKNLIRHKCKLTDDQINYSNDDYKLTCKLGAPSILISCLVSLLRSLRSELKSSSPVITPNNFVREITSSFAQFKNYDQQDSHEFLRCLLDAIRINEITRQRKSILESMGLDARRIKQMKENDDKLIEVKAYSDSSNFTVIDSLFGGYCISSLKCDDCHFTSQIFESFFDLSLPISEESDNYNNYHNNLNRKQHQQQRYNSKEKKNSRTKVHQRTTSSKNEMPQIDAVDDSNLQELENDVKNLNAKQRKLRRQLKKAAKRESKNAKLNERDLKEDNSDVVNKDDEKLDEDKTKNEDHNQSALTVDSKEYKKSSTLDEEEEDESDGESSDDEASSNELSELKNEFSEENSNIIRCDATLTENTVAGRSKTVQSNNSVDSGINSSNLTSEADTNTSKIRNLAKTISPVDEETIDCESTQQCTPLNQFNNEECINNSEKESDTGFEDRFEDRNEEADSESEESNSANVNTNDQEDDSDQETETTVNPSSLVLDNDNVFNDQNEEEKKSVRSNSAMESSDLFKRRIKWTLSTVSNREEASISCSVLAGLARFTKIELLVGANKIFCENCSLKFKNKNGVQKKIYTNGSKQMLIALPPPILTLHLKRFELSNYRSMSLSKINKFVHFPLVFDLSPYVSNVYKVISSVIGDVIKEKSERNTKSIIYSLYGIIEHSGSLRSGHYKAYVKCNNKDSKDLKKFIRLQPYLPKVADLMDLITLDDIEKVEEDQDLTEMLANMHLATGVKQMNGDLNNQPVNGESFTEKSTASADPETMNQIKEELIRVTKEKWYHISDSQVTQTPLQTVLKAQAYLLFYERRS